MCAECAPTFDWAIDELCVLSKRVLESSDALTPLARSMLDRRKVRWLLSLPFSLGALVGGMIGAMSWYEYNTLWSLLYLAVMTFGLIMLPASMFLYSKGPLVARLYRRYFIKSKRRNRKLLSGS